MLTILLEFFVAATGGQLAAFLIFTLIVGLGIWGIISAIGHTIITSITAAKANVSITRSED